MRSPYDELANVDRPVLPRDVRYDDVDPAAVRQCRVNEGLGQVDAAVTGPPHSLDEVTDLTVGQQSRRQLAAPLPGNKDPTGVVDPDLLDGRVVEVGLQRSIAGHGVIDRPRREIGVTEGRQAAGQRAFVVLGDDLVDEATYGRRVGGGIEPPTTDELAHLVLDSTDRIERRRDTGHGVIK